MSELGLKMLSIRNKRCVICFCENRNLMISINLNFVATFCPEISFNPDDKVCWECEYMIRKMIKFKEKAMLTQTFLAKRANGEYTTSLTSLSTSDVFNTSYTLDQDDSLENIDSTLEETIDKPQSEIKDTQMIEIEIGNVKVEYQNYDDGDSNSVTSETEPNIKDGPVVTKMALNNEKGTEIDNKHIEAEIDRLKNNPGIIIKKTPQTVTAPKKNMPAKVRIAYINTDKGNKKTEKTPLKRQPILYNTDKEMIATVEKVGEDKMRELREKGKMEQRYKSSKLKCETCLQKFPDASAWEKHQIKHNLSSGDFICTICDQRFPTEKIMSKHRLNHYYCYKCVVCGDAFRTQKEVNCHHTKHHSKAYCKRCNVYFDTKEDLAEHRRVIHDEKYVCTFCEETFTVKRIYQDHVLRHVHPKMLECKVCHRKYKGEMGLALHQKVSHGISKTDCYCVECDKVFKAPYSYIKHLKTASKHRTEEAYRYKCSSCTSKFVSKRELDVHVEKVHLKIEYPCRLCSKSFSQESVLKVHVKKVHEKRPLVRDKICHYCGRGYSTSALLKCHIRTHTGERPLQCKLCPANFAYPAALYTHNKLVHKAGKK